MHNAHSSYPVGVPQGCGQAGALRDYGPFSCPCSPECVEEEFSEVRQEFIASSSLVARVGMDHARVRQLAAIN
jgi:hypothetical protein